MGDGSIRDPYRPGAAASAWAYTNGHEFIRYADGSAGVCVRCGVHAGDRSGVDPRSVGWCRR